MEARILFVAGRDLIGIFFVMSGLGKAFGWSQTVDFMRMHKMPLAPVGLTIAILIELMGAIALFSGMYLHYSALILAAYAFLAACAIPLQDAIRNQNRQLASTQFGMSLAIIGGLLLVAAGQ